MYSKDLAAKDFSAFGKHRNRKNLKICICPPRYVLLQLGRICPLQDFSAAQRGQEQAASGPPRSVQLSGWTHAPGAAHRACAPSHVAALRAERVKSHGCRAPGGVLLSASLRPAGTRDRLLLLGSGSTRGSKPNLQAPSRGAPSRPARETASSN